MGCCYKIIMFFFHIREKKKWWWGVCAHPAALHALQWRRRVLLMEAGLTFDLLSGCKSGSRGSAAGQGTIANTREPRHKKRTTCGGVFRGRRPGRQHSEALSIMQAWVLASQTPCQTINTEWASGMMSANPISICSQWKVLQRTLGWFFFFFS